MSAQRRAQMKDAQTSTSSQMLSRTFYILFESIEAEIPPIPVVRLESFPSRNSGTIPASVQELVYGSKEARMGTSCKFLDRNNELLSSSEEVHWCKKVSRPSEGL
ncbi:hypothetical protein O181_000647 [Austropuccinia psidii MF-1]|uniref:Uncharacterized protein n=1 Tax=Austropuccinia psidii MF-1 TaxID=1389203 RepID=A0A9Q3GC95_9BASI|nr:hypothetical protein [Austropuccinia psidii MF-1]